VTPEIEQQGDGVIRRRVARWLLLGSAVTVLFGCQAGDPSTSAPADAAAPVVAAPLPFVPAPRDSVVPPTDTVAAARVAATTTTTEAPAPEAAAPANEMQPVPTTAAPPATTVVRRSVAAPTTVAPPVFEPAAAPLPLNAAAAVDFVNRTNSLRASLGLEALARNAQLDAYAAAWARELAASGSLRHSSSPDRAVAAGWSIAGENVGYGGSVGSVHDALVKSAGHYANLVGPSYSAIGVGVAAGADGRLWVCEVFAG
jgi:uncharacterized protein YkwD